MFFSKPQLADRHERSRRSAAGQQGSFLRLIAYTRTAWHLLLALFVCIIAKSLLELALPWVIGFMLLDGVIAKADLDKLPLVVGLLTAIFLGQKAFTFLQDYFHELSNQRIIHKLRCDLYEHIERLPLRFFEQGRTGDLQARVIGDVDTVEGLLNTLVQDMATELIMLVGTIIFLYKVDPVLTLFVLPTVPALALSVFFFKRTIKRYARLVRDLIGEMASLAGETIAGVRVVKAFCRERFEAERFAATSLNLLNARVRTARLQAIYSSTIDFWVFAGTVIVVLNATPRVIAGTFSVGALVAYLNYLNKLYGPARKLSKVNVSIQKILAAGDRIFEVIDVSQEVDLVPPVESRPKPMVPRPKHRLTTLGLADGDHFRSSSLVPLRSPKGQTSNRRPGAIQFERVSFGYDENRLVLKEFSLEVGAGEIIGLVGHSGGGKTTVVNLLLRFYQPTRGRILTDGVPLDFIPLEELRRQIGLVQQETFLFSGTLRDNIAYADPAASTERIFEAARAAYAHDFIMRLPQGYLTQVGERGVKLSGGQRQRIAIARALVPDPRILIFDEATSHLDSESERLVQQALERAAEGRTVFCIAHRLSSVWRADKIVVIEDGQIVQAGTHEELLACNGIYRQLYSLQLSPPEAAGRRRGSN